MAKRSLLDRSVVTLIQDPDPTPSARDGIPASTERLHRLHGTSLTASACRLLKLPASTYATACTVLHRYFHQVSLRHANVWSISMAAVLLAAKTEETISTTTPALTIRRIILVYTHLYRRRRFVLTGSSTSTSGTSTNTSTTDANTTNANTTNSTDNDECQRIVEHPGVGVDPLSTSLTAEAKLQHLRNDLPGLSGLGPIWKDWYDEIIQSENDILRQLGFTLYWIPEEHCHKMMLSFVKVLQMVEVEDHDGNENGNVNVNVNSSSITKKKSGAGDNERFVQRAWNYCNDCCRLDLCVRFDSEILACAAIFLTALDLHVDLQTEQPDGGVVPVPVPVPCWWHVFCGAGRELEISTVANAVLGLMAETSSITAVASKAFVVSLVPGGSFNDPGSFLWESTVVAKLPYLTIPA